MRKDKLYTVNKWNKPAFMPHKYDDGGAFDPIVDAWNNNDFDKLKGISPTAINVYNQYIAGLNADKPLSSFNFDSSKYDQLGTSATSLLPSIAAPTIKAGSLPKISLGNKLGTLAKTSAGKMGLGIVGGLANKFAYKGLSGGLESGVGKGIADVGNTVGGLISNIPGVGTLAGPIVQAASGIVGGGVSRLFGNKMNKENIANVEGNISNIRSSANNLASVADSSSLIDSWSNANTGFNFSNSYIGKDGVFSHKAKKKANKLRNAQNVATDVLNHELRNASANASITQRDNLMANFSAFGGPLAQMANNDDMGAVGYGLMSDYMNMRNNQAQAKNTVNNPYFSNFGMGNDTLFADGGGIHIKPSHQGRLTELKKRTGKTEEELYNDGNPAHKKMVVFARNARKWNHKHDEGGSLDDNKYSLISPEIGIGLSNIVVPAPFTVPEYVPIRATAKEKERPAWMDIPMQYRVPVQNLGLTNNYQQSQSGDLLKEITKKNEELLQRSSEFNRAVNAYNTGNTPFALGGVMQANGGDYSTGMTHVDEGGTHEENPYEGVQMGVAPDNTPNLVEEGEVIFDDYVYSNRIKPTKEVLKKFHMYSKGGKLTYADVAKKLEKESEERPNDPISKASLKNMLQQLAEAQEQQKADEEARRAREAFEALSPEEQAAVMQQMAAQQGQEEAVAEQQPTQQEVPVDENGNPIDAAAQQQPTQPIDESGVVGAYGGKLNHQYPDGGEMIKQAILNALKLKNGQRVLTQDMFNTWANENNVKDFDYNGDWTKALQNVSFKTALTKASPELAYVINNGFGTESPSQYVGDINTDWGKAFANYGKELGFGEPNFREQGFIPYTRNGDFTEENLKQLRGSKNYTDFTKYILDNWDSDYVQNYLKHLDKIAQGNHLYDSDGNQVEGAKDYFEKARNTGPLGYYSFTPTLKGDINKNLLVGKDGAISVIDNDDLSGLTKVGSPYKWTDANGNNTYTFYSLPEAAAKKSEEDDGEVKKIPYSDAEKLRYLGLAGPAVALGMQILGKVGKPKYGRLESSMDYLNNSGNLASYKPIGNYRRYRPMDIWSAQNRANANARATDMAIRNGNAPVGAMYTGLIANAYNNQLANANLLRQAMEYNDTHAQNVAEYNRSTDMQNANAFNETSRFNAQQRNSNAQAKASLAADIAKLELEGDATWNNGKFGNLSNLFQGISDYGREEAQFNQLAALANSGVFVPNSEFTTILTGRGNKSGKAAKGGKLKKKRGLTF